MPRPAGRDADARRGRGRARPPADRGSSCAAPTGPGPCFGDYPLFQQDPAWRDLIPFHEYFHGDTGAGLGASHQTGWTGLVADLIIRPRAARSRAAGHPRRGRPAPPRGRGRRRRRGTGRVRQPGRHQEGRDRPRQRDLRRRAASRPGRAPPAGQCDLSGRALQLSEQVLPVSRGRCRHPRAAAARAGSGAPGSLHRRGDELGEPSTGRWPPAPSAATRPRWPRNWRRCGPARQPRWPGSTGWPSARRRRVRSVLIAAARARVPPTQCLEQRLYIGPMSQTPISPGRLPQDPRRPAGRPGALRRLLALPRSVCCAAAAAGMSRRWPAPTRRRP